LRPLPLRQQLYARSARQAQAVSSPFSEWNNLMPFSARTVILVLLAALVLGVPVGAQQGRASVDPATTATIRHLLDLTGASKVALRGMDATVPAQRAANPQIPAAFWDAFLARAHRDISQLVDSLIPIYAAHFTRPELDQLVRFYESPIGRHLAELQPVIAEESIKAGQRWGAVIGRGVGDSLAHAGVKLQNPQ
jgi:hypothetical protein